MRWSMPAPFSPYLIGTISGGLLVPTESDATAAAGGGANVAAAIAMVVVAIGTYLCSRFIPRAEATDPNLKVNFNPVTSTWEVLRFAAQSRAILNSLLGISWFWLVGALILAQLPAYAKDVLGGDKTVYTLLLASFSIGTALGSLACEKLSGHKVEIGLVPLGSIGMTICLLDLYFEHPAAHAAGTAPLTWIAFLVCGRLGRGARLRPDRRVRRIVHRAAVRVDPVAQRRESSRAHHRLQQHPERRLHGDCGAAGHRLVRAAASHHSAAFHPRRGAQRRRRDLYLHAGARIPHEISLVGLREHHVPHQGARAGKHPGERARRSSSATT